MITTRKLGLAGLLPIVYGAMFFAALPAQALDWNRWRGPDQNGISQEADWSDEFPAEGPKRLWKASVGTGFSSMAVAHERVYTLGNDGSNDTVFCFNAVTGAPVWKYSYPCSLDPKLYEGGPNATPTVDDKRVYTLSRKGDLFCLDAETGKVFWSKNVHKDLNYEIPSWGFSGSPVAEGKLLILDVGKAGLALNRETGDVVWASATDTPGYSTPVMFNYGGQHVAVISAAESIEIVKVADGKLVWSYPWKTDYNVNAADPVLFGGAMFISSGYGHGSALLDIDTGRPVVKWTKKDLRTHINTAVLWNGYLYAVDDISSHDYALKCVAWGTGEVKWSEPKFGKGTLMIADGKIIGLSDKGELMIAEATPEHFKPSAHAQVLGGRCWTVPVLCNGRLYCRNSKGDLICLDLSGKTKH